MRSDKVNVVLDMCGHVLEPVPLKRGGSVMSRRAKVSFHDRLAGRLTEDENGYFFNTIRPILLSKRQRL